MTEEFPYYLAQWITNNIRGRIKQIESVKYFWDRLEPIPKNSYIVYQTQDLQISGKNSYQYRKFLDDALTVYQYSIPNLQYLNNSKFLPIMVPKEPPLYWEGDKSADVLLYGTLSSRRQKIVNKLKTKGYKVVHIPTTNYTNLVQLIHKSKWVLSVGTYNNIHNDLIRIAFALDHGGNVICEKSQEQWSNQVLKKYPDRIVDLQEMI